MNFLFNCSPIPWENYYLFTRTGNRIHFASLRFYGKMMFYNCEIIASISKNTQSCNKHRKSNTISFKFISFLFSFFCFFLLKLYFCLENNLWHYLVDILCKQLQHMWGSLKQSTKLISILLVCAFAACLCRDYS